MTVPAALVVPTDLTPAEFRTALRQWLDSSAGRLPSPSHEVGASFRARIDGLRALQRVLYDTGWARYGWAPDLGGLGGDARHRAVLYDELSRAGFPSRSSFEHVEILAPTLVHHWERAMTAAVLPAFLRGDELWCQGFSEPDAGSDLMALRTRATLDGDTYRLDGRKIWTSWAGVADRCLVLARTGSIEERHRGLSVFFVDLDSPGIEVRPLKQANGLDELAEVSFDGVPVPRERLVGPAGSGLTVALDTLSCERSAFAWLRQTTLYARADELARAARPADAAVLGELMVDLFALRVSSADAVHQLAEGTFLGPAAAPVKVQLTATEQRLYDAARRILGPGLVLGDDAVADADRWQEDYLFSRIVSVYGGTKQVQLTTIARFLLDLPTAS